MRLGIFGRGRLGSLVAELASREGGIELAWIVDKGESPGGGVDIALDASVAEAVPGHLAWAGETGTNLVIGTTGWNHDALEPFKGTEPAIGVLVAANFSLGAAFMRRAALALARFASLDGSSEISVAERHHRGKADAPSGTAKSLVEAIVRGCPRYDGWSFPPAIPRKVPMASLRAGAEPGFHEIRYSSGAETIVFSHAAASREIFARGAIQALSWMQGRKGFFTFDDMAFDMIASMFRE